MNDFAFWTDWSDLKMWEKFFVPLKSLRVTGGLTPKLTFPYRIFESFAGVWPALDLLLFLKFSLAEGWRTNCPSSSNKSEIPGNGDGQGIWERGWDISEIKRSGALHTKSSFSLFYFGRFMVKQFCDLVTRLARKRLQVTWWTKYDVNCEMSSVEAWYVKYEVAT